MIGRPHEHARSRDREFERIVRDHFTRLVDDFVARGFKRREARLWVGAWRHIDHPEDLARAALAFHHLRVESGQAIPWYWERIEPEIAVRYLPHRWRAAEARRVMQALQQHDPNLSRRQALHLGLRWAQAGFTADETQHAISVGRDPARSTASDMPHRGPVVRQLDHDLSGRAAKTT
jgi:hypothetical protein